jgi:hypothetical protein
MQYSGASALKSSIPTVSLSPRDYFDDASSRFRQMGSSFYALLSRECRQDEDILALASEAAPGQPATHLLFGAVQFLLFEDPGVPLAAYYPSIAKAPLSEGEAFAEFRAFCLRHRERIALLMKTRIVQTTVVRRAAFLLPAMAHVAALVGAPLSIVEVGCSAGLLTLFDHYRYDFGDGVVIVELDGPLVSGFHYIGAKPPMPARMPEIRERIGIDLHPVDPRDLAEARWIDAVLPADLIEDRRQLRAALDYRARTPLQVVAGDALKALPGILSTLPDPVCVFHSHCLYQWPETAKDDFERVLVDASRTRDIYRIGIEYFTGSDPTISRAVAGGHPLIHDIRLMTYRKGDVHVEVLGHYDGWGRNGVWLAAG